MFIKEIKDYISCEATVVVSDGKYEIACFADLCGEYEIACCADLTAINDNREFKLATFLAQNITISESTEALVEKKEGYYEYKLIGKVVSKDKNLIEVGKILIELDDNIPNDLHDGDFVELECIRVDIYN